MQLKDRKDVLVRLSRDCHLKRSTNCAQNLNANHHILRHLLKVHRISAKIALPPYVDAALPENA